MKLKNEDQILNHHFRKQVIHEITANENTDRKNKALRRHECYRDMTKKWVIERLHHENLKDETIRMMEQRAANISIVKKVVNKLARVYSGGVVREHEDEQVQDKLLQLQKLLNLDNTVRKANRWEELHKNAMLQVVPEVSTRASRNTGREIMKHSVRALAPWQYDVIEDWNNPEEPRVVILSEFIEANTELETSSAAQHGERGIIRADFDQGNDQDEIIADNPADSGEDKRRFIWWSDLYHFTTDDKGNIIDDGEDKENPIGLLPFVKLAEDQDGEFWAQGGDDLIDGAVLINLLLTDMNSIANQQGWGQMVITGKNIPENIKVGPHNALVLPQQESDEPAPQVFFANSNPPLDSWMQSVEQFTALLLSTNNLSPSQIAGQLGADNFPSGIAMLVENAQATDNIEDKQTKYKEKESELWHIISLWQNYLFQRDALTNTYKAIGELPENVSELNVKFLRQRPIITEKEKVEIMQARKKLGIDTMVDLIQRDDPSLSEEEAQKKLKQIKQEQVENLVKNQEDQDGGDAQSGDETSAENTQGQEAKQSDSRGD